MAEPSSKKSTRARRKGKAPRAKAGPRESRWTFLSNHAHVLICLAQDPAVRIRDISRLTGITERAVLKIVADLEQQGLIQRHREGRRNVYELKLDHPLRHPLESHHAVGELIDLIIS